MNSDAIFSFGREETKRNFGFRLRRPQSQNDLFFGFALRVVIGIVAIIFPVVPLTLWGWLSSWHLSNTMLAAYGFTIATMVLVGEHFRSRVFERVLRSNPRQEHLEIDRTFITDALAEVFPQPERRSLVRMRYMAKVKHLLDVGIATISLLSLWPIFVVVSCLIIFERSGSVIVTDTASDVFGRKVKRYRFRTVSRTGEVTAVGKFLRTTSLDELPLLFNVARGTMSFVGPRLTIQKIEAIPLPDSVRYFKPGLLDPVISKSTRVETVSLTLYTRRVANYCLSWWPGYDVPLLLREIRGSLSRAGRI
ncbi:Sugar transferase [Rhizobium freirei PRF 81]|uniref:Sugar transferase n=2 Tax=Rhizobium freirei TaxID=1353277 RepID=N6V9E0_9HYPH|nr:Sugar transferase [Rhizobium freirei PRF 81]